MTALLHAERILEYVGNLCTAANLGVTTASRSFPFAINDDQLPLVSINQVSDEPVAEEPTNLIYNDWKLTVEFVCIVKTSTTPADTQLNAIRALIHSQLFQDYTQGGLCVDTTAAHVELSIADGDKADAPVTIMRAQYVFTYQTKITDLTV